MAGIEADVAGLAAGGLAAATDFESMLLGYEKFLRGQRGLSDNTVRIYRTDLVSFRRYMSLEGLSLKAMNRRTLRCFMAGVAVRARAGATAVARGGSPPAKSAERGGPAPERRSVSKCQRRSGCAGYRGP